MKPLQRAAWIAFIAHLIAGFAMAVVLRRGLETTPDLHERMAFIVNHRAWWTMSWLTWVITILTAVNVVGVAVQVYLAWGR